MQLLAQLQPTREPAARAGLACALRRALLKERAPPEPVKLTTALRSALKGSGP